MPQPVLVIVDVQDRLFTAMSADRRDTMIANVKILGGAARRLGVPIVLTEQYPKGLGRTLPELRALLGDLAPVEKTSFSCGAAGGFTERLRALGAERAVLCGMEAHVCVLLTALDLLENGFRLVVSYQRLMGGSRDKPVLPGFALGTSVVGTAVTLVVHAPDGMPGISQRLPLHSDQGRNRPFKT